MAGPRKRKTETEEEFLERKRVYDEFQEAAAAYHKANGIVPFAKQLIEKKAKSYYWGRQEGWQMLPRRGGVAERIIEIARRYEAGNQRVEIPDPVADIPPDRILMPGVNHLHPVTGLVAFENTFGVLRRITGETWRDYKRRLKAAGWAVWKDDERRIKYLKPRVIDGVFGEEYLPPLVNQIIWLGDVRYRITEVNGRAYVAVAHHPTLAEALQPAPINRPAPVDPPIPQVWSIGGPINPGQEITMQTRIVRAQWEVVEFRARGTRHLAQVVRSDEATTTFRGLTTAQTRNYYRLNPTHRR